MPPYCEKHGRWYERLLGFIGPLRCRGCTEEARAQLRAERNHGTWGSFYD